jgi:hypothetical protein
VTDAGSPQGRTRARTGIRTWPVERARRAWGAAWPQPQFAVPARAREWAAIEVGAGRLLPWFAVAFGAGIVLYFTADHEPDVWAAAALAVGAGIGAVVSRRRPFAFVLALGFFAIASGFAVATLKTALISHPVLRYPGIMAQTPLILFLVGARPSIGQRLYDPEKLKIGPFSRVFLGPVDESLDHRRARHFAANRDRRVPFICMRKVGRAYKLHGVADTGYVSDAKGPLARPLRCLTIEIKILNVKFGLC